MPLNYKSRGRGRGVSAAHYYKRLAHVTPDSAPVIFGVALIKKQLIGYKSWYERWSASHTDRPPRDIKICAEVLESLFYDL